LSAQAVEYLPKNKLEDEMIERVRLIIDAPLSDARKAFDLAISAHENKDRSHILEWGYWRADDPSFSAVTRINKNSILIKTNRSEPCLSKT
jgi:hypothetical protein